MSGLITQGCPSAASQAVLNLAELYELLFIQIQQTNSGIFKHFLNDGALHIPLACKKPQT